MAEGSGAVITPTILDSINNESAARENRGRLEELGGVEEIALGLGVNLDEGLESTQIMSLRAKFGNNMFPESPMESFFDLLLAALSDSTIVILIAAATVSLVIGIVRDPHEGWVEGTAIFSAVGAVSLIAAGNDYTKQLQFKALEDASAKDEQTGVIRNGRKEMVPVQDLVVGDIMIFQSGDSVPADCIIYDQVSICKCNESSLTGETDDLKKSKDSDPFLLSSCLVIDVEGQECRAMAIAVGRNSQWGKIKGNLAVPAASTPLQDKLEVMTKQIGYVGVVAAIGTFFALFIRIWASPKAPITSQYIAGEVINAFIMGVTIVVVAIPEGLPLAVTISLAYSTKKMYSDNCFIRVLAACETMGNATNICSDKTGTLTENKMAVVEGWFAGRYYDRQSFTVSDTPEYWAGGNHSASNSVVLPDQDDSLGSHAPLRQESNRSDNSGSMSMSMTGSGLLRGVRASIRDPIGSVIRKKPPTVSDTSTTYKMKASAPPVDDQMKKLIAEHISVNRTAYLITHDRDTGLELPTPAVQGSKTEGALILLSRAWGLDYDHLYTHVFRQEEDKIFSFNSLKKRSTSIVHRADGSVRLFCKGASEQILQDCRFYTTEEGTVKPMTLDMFNELTDTIAGMANRALRTLVLAHKDFSDISELPYNWRKEPPDNQGLCCDCIVGIMDPLRSDVKVAVAAAKSAGVIVRMVTGDNIQTAMAIATECGILTPGGLAIEGPQFRRMTPASVDGIISRLQVVARSSPDDKHTLVTRLNGHAIPKTKQDWEERFKDRMERDPELTWESARDKLLPGYREEWEKSRPEGGQVVGVTGDGTNDAPALKAADVGLAMGITGTKVAQGAADIVILDDRFSSIVRAMMWGRSVYDNIRKFLQFQLTVNLVALLLVFFGAALGYEEPINAVQMLWVNLIMDTFGALALGTEPPIRELLERKPYKRTASLISIPMRRNIVIQAAFQLAVLFILMIRPQIFLIDVELGEPCREFRGGGAGDGYMYDLGTMSLTTDSSKADIDCSSFESLCPDMTGVCFHATHTLDDTTGGTVQTQEVAFSFHELPGYEDECLTCTKHDYTHGSVLFNTFIWCQIFNEYSSRVLFNELNMFHNIMHNTMFFAVSIFTIGCQVILIELGGEFMKTEPLPFRLWIITIIIGSFTIPVGFLMRLLLPVDEDPRAYFDVLADAISDVKDDGAGLSSGVNLKTITKPSGQSPPSSSGPKKEKVGVAPV